MQIIEFKQLWPVNQMNGGETNVTSRITGTDGGGDVQSKKPGFRQLVSCRQKTMIIYQSLERIQRYINDSPSQQACQQALIMFQKVIHSDKCIDCQKMQNALELGINLSLSPRMMYFLKYQSIMLEANKPQCIMIRQKIRNTQTYTLMQWISVPMPAIYYWIAGVQSKLLMHFQWVLYSLKAGNQNYSQIL